MIPSPELITAIASLLLTAVAVGNAFLTSRKLRNERALANCKLQNEKRLNRSQETLNIGQSYEGLVNNYQEQRKEDKAEIASLRKRLKEAEHKILDLSLQLSQAIERITVLESERDDLIKKGILDG